VGTDIRDGNGTTRMVNWCGSVIQDPHPAVRALGFLPEEGHGVYVARYCLFLCKVYYIVRRFDVNQPGLQSPSNRN